MIKDIRYSGYSTAPSDYDCQDGALTTSLNIINEDGGLRRICQPSEVLTLRNGEIALLIHNVPGQTNWIFLRGNKDAAFTLHWMIKSDDVENTEGAVRIDCPADVLNGFRDIAIIGNTIAVATNKGVQYLIWKDDAYKYLGNRPPFISIDFGMYKVGMLNDSEKYSIPARCAPGWSGQRGQAEKSELAQLTQHAYGLLNPAIADKVTSQGYFYQPFFVRYAYRLYDGSYSWHSAPILMLPTIVPPFIKYADDGSHPGAEGTLEATLTLNVPYFALAYRILTDGTEELANWSDLVAGIDIFVSAPIYTYDQSKDLPWRPVGYTLSTILSIAPEYKGGRNPVPDEVFIGHYADSLTGKYIDRTMSTAGASAGNADYYQILNIRQHDNFIRNIQETHDFYKLAEIDIKDIKPTTAMTDLKITNADLSSLVTRQTLEDDYQSHCNIVASSLYSFNSRLNLAGVEISPAEPFPIRSIMQFGNPDGLSTTRVQIKVWTRLNGVRCYAVHTGADTIEADIWYFPAGNFPRYIYYPDASAYKMEIFITESQKYTIDLVPHDFLNGAYYFMGRNSLGKDSLPTNTEPETVECKTSVSVGAKIYTSEINNPFTFSVLGINTIGSGDVYAICSAVKALSQGQFGQFPLYAFTSEGVWALETTAAGTYSAKQPITRDVCINPESITQIDSAVLFATDRGIMMVSGSNTQCISDAVNTDTPFSVLELPRFAEVYSANIDTSLDRCLPTLPFLQFLKNCRMIYDYVHQHIIVYNPRVTYGYVYSLKSQQWGMMHADIYYNVPSYPNAFAVDSFGTLVDFSENRPIARKGVLVTRPLKLDAPDVLKTIDTVIQRGHFRRGHVQCILYGSRDLFSWHLVWSSKDHYLRGFRGSPYKYFRIALLCDLEADESISGVSVQFTPRQTEQPL